MPDQLSVQAIIQETIHRYHHPPAQVLEIEPAVMGTDERGWSGAQIQRYRVHLKPDEITTVIVKTMPLKERLVMQRLTEQGHENVPFSFCPDLNTDDLIATCMQDLGSHRVGIPDAAPLPPAASAWDSLVAQALAAIHLQNLGKQAEFSWLPQADVSYIQDFLVKEVWRSHWEQAVRTIPAFAREFAGYTASLETSADQLKRTISALWQENHAVTLTHGEVHGEHVMIYQNRPYLIDWGWAYYGPFYLDLPAYFTPQTVHFYRQALAEKGLNIPESEFMERFREIGRYVGFKYLCTGIWQWGQGPTTRMGRRLLLMLKWAIDGIWPERAFYVSPEAWSQLLSQHSAFISSQDENGRLATDGQ